jgi:uncharacterized protein YjiS (DUF1127 family)
MIFTFFAGLVKAWKNYLMYRKTVYELNRLTNRDLADLGIHRGDIEFIARKHSTGAFKV